MAILALALGACSTNTATGRTQFAGLMSPAQENQIGASEHEKIVAQYGLYKDPKLNAYVTEIGRRVSKETERPDVLYKFFIIDSPIVNAFALPGGYIYISRGLLALANSEAELAGVIAHEIGHITGRHSAERYSHGVLASLGTAVISAAVDKQGVSQALGVGSNLYMSSYSRSQESEADNLGVRYLARGGYDTKAMSSFLSDLQAHSALEQKAQGESGAEMFSYFSTHPATSDRVAKAAEESRQYAPGGDWGHDKYLGMLDGITYGDSAEQGFARGQSFYHPVMGFAFDVPKGFYITNQPSQVVAVSKQSGAVMIFDMTGAGDAKSPADYLSRVWMKDNPSMQGLESISINGMKAATASFSGKVNNQNMTIRLIAAQWDPSHYARFQIGIPAGTSTALLDDLKRASYSLRRLSEKEKQELRPDHVKIITAKSSDNVESLSQRQSFTNLQEERFRVLNGLGPRQETQPGNLYKLVVN